MNINRSDYDYIAKISRKIGKDLEVSREGITEKEKERLGFYYLGLKMLTGVQDSYEIDELIIDTEYQSIVHNNKNDDYGIDAVFIDTDSKIIKLFSFKYREKFEAGTLRGVDELKNCTPFLLYLDLNEGERFRDDFFQKSDDNETKRAILEVIEHTRDSYDYTYELVLVSNDCKKLDRSSVDYSSFNIAYPWLNIKEFNLEDLSQELAIKPESNNSFVILNRKELLQHDMDGYTTANSYVGKVRIIDLIKMTSLDYKLRIKDDIADSELIKVQKIDNNILFDNVRGFLGETPFNEKILDTLLYEPEKFFLYNNGITITADDIIVKPVKMDECYKVELVNYQIVNGGQTLRTIYKFIDEYPDKVNNLAKSSVLIRFFKTGLEDGLINKVAEYTNSQNAINGRDLRSVDDIQLDIEKKLMVENIKYLRKRTIDISDDKFEYEISMEKLGQLLLAEQGHPEKVSNSKKRIFDSYYNKLFIRSGDFIGRSTKLIKQYYSITDEYKNLEKISHLKFYEQKVFYIIYLNKCMPGHKVEENIQLLENVLNKFRTKEDVSPARKLIQKAFKESLDEEIKKITNKEIIFKPIKL